MYSKQLLQHQFKGRRLPICPHKKDEEKLNSANEELPESHGNVVQVTGGADRAGVPFAASYASGLLQLMDNNVSNI